MCVFFVVFMIGGWMVDLSGFDVGGVVVYCVVWYWLDVGDCFDECLCVGCRVDLWLIFVWCSGYVFWGVDVFVEFVIWGVVFDVV